MLAALAVAVILAADRAVLVGVDQFADPLIQLAGVDQGLRLMTVVAGVLCFSQQRALRGSESSRPTALVAMVGGPLQLLRGLFGGER